ncbi:regulatory protein ArsR [Parvibaculum lavamentivorans DS-1]|uniref:Regulatory protein ArsR n=1 Tax=Parvibaculum lavamentivorans (strain DS-1 / DSM 13023 / NCIMB 13966) TaxID=402881 RepID=A7HW33_PARL1|nr:metalloregulator ArsR/SmtB family transcription factor [Parvibaculum lavamentivorans]ABS64116.1 regulatory protein ArsR [Parvibaculum lavamentivorans DS-1]
MSAAPAEPEEIDRILAALADPTRRRMVDLLRDGPMRAGELAAAFDISGPAVSRHLRVLRENDLIEEEAAGDDRRLRVYRLRAAPFADLQSWLEEVAAFWTVQLSAFKKHAEGKSRKGRKK